MNTYLTHTNTTNIGYIDTQNRNINVDNTYRINYAAFIGSRDYRITWRAFIWPEIRLMACEHDLWTGVWFSDSIFTCSEFKPETPILAIVFVCYFINRKLTSMNTDTWVINAHQLVKSCSRVVKWWIHDFPRTKWTQHKPTEQEQEHDTYHIYMYMKPVSTWCLYVHVSYAYGIHSSAIWV